MCCRLWIVILHRRIIDRMEQFEEGIGIARGMEYPQDFYAFALFICGDSRGFVCFTFHF